MDNIDLEKMSLDKEGATRLMEAIFLSPREANQNEAKRSFVKLVNLVNKGLKDRDLSEAYECYLNILERYADAEKYASYCDDSDFVAYVNEEKKTVALKNKNGFVTKVKCDENDAFNMHAGVALAYMKSNLGFTNSREFVEFINSKVHEYESKDNKELKAGNEDLMTEQTKPVSKSDESAKKIKIEEPTSSKPKKAKTTTKTTVNSQKPQNEDELDPLKLIKDAINAKAKKENVEDNIENVLDKIASTIKDCIKIEIEDDEKA